MLTKEYSHEIVKKALSLISADMSEAVLETERLSLTRFAESKISDNIDNEESILYLRIIRDNKIGVIATGDLTDDGIRDAASKCSSRLNYVEPDPNFKTLPTMDLEINAINNMIKGTSDFGPIERAKAIDIITRVARKGASKASGAFRQEERQLVVGNSLGMQRFFHGNNAQLSVTIAGEHNNSGWASEYNPDASKIDYNSIAQTALKKAATSRDPITLADGQYTVILEPAAVGQFLLLLSFMGFGGKTMYQRRSFMARGLDQQIAGDNFTVSETAGDSAFNYCPFDYEGVKRKRVEIITNGIAKGVVYNSYYANLMDKISTGHALSAVNSYGPYPKTMLVEPGKSSLDEMIKSTERGIYITHFWYLNFLNPMKTMVTGTTIDGTYLIENGKLTKPIKNMRTNQSILEAFSNIESLTTNRIIHPQYSVLMKIPGMKINNFNLAQEEEEGGGC